MAQLRGIPRTAKNAAAHSEDEHDPGRRSYRVINNEFDLSRLSPRQRGEDEGEGLELHLPVSERFRNPHPPLSLARERRTLSRRTFKPALHRNRQSRAKRLQKLRLLLPTVFCESHLSDATTSRNNNCCRLDLPWLEQAFQRMGCSRKRNGNLQNSCAGMGGPFGRANASSSKKKPALIGRSSLQVAGKPP